MSLISSFHLFYKNHIYRSLVIALQDSTDWLTTNYQLFQAPSWTRRRIQESFCLALISICVPKLFVNLEMTDPYRIPGISRRYRGCRYCPGVSRWDICPPDQDMGRAVEGWHCVSTTHFPPYTYRQHVDGSAQSPGACKADSITIQAQELHFWHVKDWEKTQCLRCCILVQFRKNHPKCFFF